MFSPLGYILILIMVNLTANLNYPTDSVKSYILVHLKKPARKSMSQFLLPTPSYGLNRIDLVL